MTDTSSATLTDKQELFIREYMVDLNASAAARRAGYSARSSGPQSGALMRHPLIRARIRERIDAIYAKLRINEIEVWHHQARIAFFDASKLLDEFGWPIPLRDLDKDTRAAMIISYDQRPDGTYVIKVRPPSRQAALKAIAKRFAWEQQESAQAAVPELLDEETGVAAAFEEQCDVAPVEPAVREYTAPPPEAQVADVAAPVSAPARLDRSAHAPTLDAPDQEGGLPGDPVARRAATTGPATHPDSAQGAPGRVVEPGGQVLAARTTPQQRGAPPDISGHPWHHLLSRDAPDWPGAQAGQNEPAMAEVL